MTETIVRIDAVYYVIFLYFFDRLCARPDHMDGVVFNQRLKKTNRKLDIYSIHFLARYRLWLMTFPFGLAFFLLFAFSGHNIRSFSNSNLLLSCRHHHTRHIRSTHPSIPNESQLYSLSSDMQPTIGND